MRIESKKRSLRVPALVLALLFSLVPVASAAPVRGGGGGAGPPAPWAAVAQTVSHWFSRLLRNPDPEVGSPLGRRQGRSELKDSETEYGPHIDPNGYASPAEPSGYQSLIDPVG